MKYFLMHPKAHKVSAKGVFFFHYFLATSMTNIEPKFPQVCYCYAYVGTHQVRILVLDYYQTRPVPLITENHERSRLPEY